MLALDHARNGTQILNAGIGARADEHAIERNVGDLLSAVEAHIGEGGLGRAALVLVRDVLRPRYPTGHRDDLLGAGAPGHERRKLRRLKPDLAIEMGSLVRAQGLPVAHRIVPLLAFWSARAALEVFEGLLVGGDEARL